MIGAIAGDIIGSVYEWNNIKTKDYPLFAQNAHFTDDSVLTVALADSILTGIPYGAEIYRISKRSKRAALFAGGCCSRACTSQMSIGCFPVCTPDGRI